MKAAWSESSSIRSSFKVSPYSKSDHVHDHHLRHFAIHPCLHVHRWSPHWRTTLVPQSDLTPPSNLWVREVYIISILQQDLKQSSSEDGLIQLKSGSTHPDSPDSEWISARHTSWFPKWRKKSEPSCEKIHARVSIGATLMAVSTIFSRCKSIHVFAVFAVANPF